jgi:nucleoside-diphosphate-sugar epimerase
MPQYRNGLNLLITGASGNLGRKLMTHAAAADWCASVAGLSYESMDASGFGAKARTVEADLTDARDPRWRKAFEGVDTVVQLAARNPYLDASWQDAAASVDILLNVVEAMRQTGGRRLVYATSNLVMGGYKEANLGPGELTTLLTPRPGVRVGRADGEVDAMPYAAAKLMSERICTSFAIASGGACSAIGVRIGWCRPGDNLPTDITLEAIPGLTAKGEPTAQSQRDIKWLRDMWLSNRDLCALISCAARVEDASLPRPAVLVNGNSANSGMPWDQKDAKAWLGYAPQDDVYARAALI